MGYIVYDVLELNLCVLTYTWYGCWIFRAATLRTSGMDDRMLERLFYGRRVYYGWWFYWMVVRLHYCTALLYYYSPLLYYCTSLLYDAIVEIDNVGTHVTVYWNGVAATLHC